MTKTNLSNTNTNSVLDDEEKVPTIDDFTEERTTEKDNELFLDNNHKRDIEEEFNSHGNEDDWENDDPKYKENFEDDDNNNPWSDEEDGEGDYFDDF